MQSKLLTYNLYNSGGDKNAFRLVGDLNTCDINYVN